MAFFLSSLNPWIVAIALNSVLLAIAFLLPKKLLTPAGYLHAWILGVLVWGCLGWRGYVVVMFYFLVGSGVTRIGKAQKEAEGIAEKRGGARGPENVWGSALTATLCAVGVAVFCSISGTEFPPLSPEWAKHLEMSDVVAPTMSRPNALPLQTLPLPLTLLLLGYVASFATKLSDTTASEVGKAYGKRTFLITTLQPVPRGTEGAVSLEGTLAGIVASIAIALVGWGVGCIDVAGVGVCVVAAFVATNAESVIGATLQSQFDWLTNEVVNILNTTIGAIAAIFLAWAYLSVV